jgi:hypothetical protein
MTDTPNHRAAFASRSGDTHVIGKDGKIRNVDQDARDAAAKPKRAPARRKASGTKKAKPRATPAAASAPAPTPSGEA